MSETYTPEQIEAVVAKMPRTLRFGLLHPNHANERTATVLRSRGLIDCYQRTARGEAVAAYLREKEQTR